MLRRILRRARPLILERSSPSKRTAPGRPLEGHDEPSDRGLAAARLADQAEGLALTDGEGDVGHGLDGPDLALGEAPEVTTNSFRRCATSRTGGASRLEHAARAALQPCGALIGGTSLRARCPRVARLVDGVEAGVEVVRRARDPSQWRAPRSCTARWRWRSAGRSGTPASSRLENRAAARDVVEHAGWSPVPGSGSTGAAPRRRGGACEANSSVGRRHLDDLAGVHDHDPVAAAGDDPEVVGDEDHGHFSVHAARRSG